MSEPLPCPFCGLPPIVDAMPVHDTTPEPRCLFWVMCNTYGCRVAFEHGEWTEQAAVERWNTRAEVKQ